MDKVLKMLRENYLVAMIAGMLLGISSTLRNLDADSSGSDDVIGQSVKSFADVLQAVKEDNADKTITALNALIAAAQSWVSYLKEKQTEKASSGLSVEVNVSK